MTVHMRVEAGVATLTVDNPELNLLTMGIRARLAHLAEQVRDNADCRVVLVTGAGQRAFSAGSDVTEFPTSAAAGTHRAVREHELFATLAELPQPTVAALHGHVLGGGLELALCCDIRIADVTATLGFPEVTLGLLPCGGGSTRLPALVGAPAAKKLLLTGQRLDADRAWRHGLVDDVVAAGQAPEAARDLATQIAAAPAHTSMAIKHIVNQALTHGPARGLALEEELVGPQFASRYTHDAVHAFLTRSP